MAQAVIVTNGEVPISGQAAIPVAVDNSLPAVGPARNVIVVTSGPMIGGSPLVVANATGVLTGIGPAIPVYVVSGSLGGIAYLLRDEFTTNDAAPLDSPRAAEPGPGTGTKNDSGNRLSIINDRLFAASGSGAWDNPSLWYGALDGTLLGAAAALIRIKGASIVNPAVIVHAAANVNPTTTGLGLIYNQPTFRAVKVDAPVSSPAARIRSIDYVISVVRRVSGGAWVAVSGGIYGTYPSATLMWIDDTDSIAASAFVGLSGNDTAWLADSVRAIRTSDLTAALGTRYGIAADYDTFTRANAASLGASEGQGTAWTLSAPSGSPSGAIVSNTATITNSADVRATVTLAALPRIAQVTVNTPSSGAIWAGLVWRHGGGQYLLLHIEATKWVIESRSANGGSAITLAQAVATYNNSTAYRLLAIDYGTHIYCFVDNTALNGGTAIATTYNNTQFGAGFQRAPGADNGSSFDLFAVWPSTITLPTALMTVPAPVASGSTVFGPDTFTAANGTALSTYDPAWSTAGAGSWEINTNKARISVAATAGYAFRSTGAAGANHQAQADVTVPNTTPTYPTDWYCGVIVRYTDTNNFIGARFIYQNNNPEIEVVEKVGGSESVLEAVLVIGDVAPNGTYTLALAVSGNEAAISFGGELVIQTRVSLTTGSNAGMFVSSGVALSGQPTWDNFTIRQAA